MKYLFLIVFISVYILFGVELGYTPDSPLYTHATYMFQHSNITHLAINSAVFFITFNTLQKYVKWWALSIFILLSGFTASFLALYKLPTVGASSMIYSMIGIYTGLTLLCRQIKIANTRRYLLFLFGVALSLTLSYFRHYSNFHIHLFSLIMGFVISTPISLKRNRAYQNR